MLKLRPIFDWVLTSINPLLKAGNVLTLPVLCVCGGHLHTPAILALEDGSIFHGYSIGAQGQSVAEVVFNTAMTGYQEILTDPSYARQIVTLTYPHIGNTGTNSEDEESIRTFCAGLVIRDLPLWRATFATNNHSIIICVTTMLSLSQVSIPASSPVYCARRGHKVVVLSHRIPRMWSRQYRQPAVLPVCRGWIWPGSQHTCCV